MRKILVLRGGALGDFIVTLPALAALRQRWPAARIELAGNATAAPLARARGLLDAAHSQHEARWSALFDAAPLPAEFSAWLAEFDLIINYWPDPDGALRRHFPLRAGQIFLTADALPSRGPAAAHYAAPLRALGIEPGEPFFALAPAAQRLPGSRNRKILVRASVDPGQNLTISATGAEPTIYIHPGSGSPRKNWPMENWLALIDQLPAPVSLILGEAELPRWNVGAQACCALPSHEGAASLRPYPNQRLEDKQLHLLTTPPLEDLVAHLSGCALFLGHDSGVSHLAAACGARCVLLFGPTDPAIWAPPAPRVRVLQHGPDLGSISIEAVLHAAEAALADQR